jgi:hypothetical protein
MIDNDDNDVYLKRLPQWGLQTIPNKQLRKICRPIIK